MKPAEPHTLVGRLMRQSLRSAVRMPPAAATRLFGEPPRNDRGAPLDAQLHVMLEMIATTGSPRLEELGAAEARAIYRRASQSFDLDPRPMRLVEERRCPGPAGEIPIRIYRPDLSGHHAARLGGPAGDLPPACVFFHGGGFVVGCPDTYDGFCRALARLAGCVVLSVDYRLAPEHPFPGPVDDCVAAFRWIHANATRLGIDPERIVVAGDSAGANLATVVCQQQIVDGDRLPVHQLLIYPSTDFHTVYASRELFCDGFYLTRSLMEWFASCYTGSVSAEAPVVESTVVESPVAESPAADPLDPRLSPLHFDALHAMPAATVITAGFDPLRDEGEAYVRRLDEAGVSVAARSFDQLTHGFVSMGGIVDAAAHAVVDTAVELGHLLHR